MLVNKIIDLANSIKNHLVNYVHPRLLPNTGNTGDVLVKTQTGYEFTQQSSVSTKLVGKGGPDIPATTEGMITGDELIGTEYYSTDGANVGAFQWIKLANGWTCALGDTGWIDILYMFDTAKSSNPTYFKIRRYNNTVFIEYVGILTGKDKVTTIPLPSGFMAERLFYRYTPGFGDYIAQVHNDNHIYFVGGNTNGSSVNYHFFSFPTITAWPITLPTAS